jgi:hypothetical protein
MVILHFRLFMFVEHVRARSQCSNKFYLINGGIIMLLGIQTADPSQGLRLRFC